MSKNSKLASMMLDDLPSITYQKRLSYRTSMREVLSLYRLINQEIFGNKLPQCKIEVTSHCKKYWGICVGLYPGPHPNPEKSVCTIRISDKWFCRQWLITTLAHEMVHQYQWDVNSRKRMKEGKEPLISHGPSFFEFREKLAKHNISLKRSHGMKRWFRHQNLWKC